MHMQRFGRLQWGLLLRLSQNNHRQSTFRPSPPQHQHILGRCCLHKLRAPPQPVTLRGSAHSRILPGVQAQARWQCWCTVELARGAWLPVRCMRHAWFNAANMRVHHAWQRLWWLPSWTRNGTCWD